MVGDFRYEEIIQRGIHSIATRTMMPRDAVASVTLVAGTYDYAVSASLTIQSVSQAFLNSTGDELVFVPFDEFNAYYKQDTALPRASGTPAEFTLWENTSGLTRVRFGPTPSAAGTVKIHYSSITSPTTDSGFILFADDLITALVSWCAADIVVALDRAILTARGLDKSSAGPWIAEANQIIRGYNVRQGNLGLRQNHVLRYGGRRNRSMVA
jgi:hypothetical protein